MENFTKPKQNIKAWEEFGPEFLQRAIISMSEVHYGLCIAGENELQLLPELEGKNVLDIGCGGGENCIALSKLGAQVVGIEPCTSLYEAAVDKSLSIPNILYCNSSYGEAICSVIKTFDIVLFIGSSEYLVFDSMFFQHLRSLTSVGTFVLLARMHPFWTTLFLHENDPEIIRSYFENGRADRLLYGSGKCSLQRFHYGVSDILDKFSANGFRINKISEPEIVHVEQAPFYISGCYDDPILTERLSKLPMTIIFKFAREW